MKLRDKLKNSKLLNAVKTYAPHIIDKVGDVLPDKGALGVVKNLIQMDDNISAENKIKMLEAYEQDLKVLEIEAADRDSARNREIEIAKVKGTDWMMYLVGGIVLLSFIVIIYAAIWVESVQENKIFIHILGMVEGVSLSIVYYYFGSSKGSKEKDGHIDKLLGK